MTKMESLAVTEWNPSIIDRYIAAIRVDLLFNYLMERSNGQHNKDSGVVSSKDETH